MASRSESRRQKSSKEIVLQIATRSLDRARAWRFVLATRLMGVRPIDDQSSDTMRDMFDALITIRCELNALHAALVQSGVLDEEDVIRRIGEAAEEVNTTYEALFPGLWVDEEGTIHFDENGRPPDPPAERAN